MTILANGTTLQGSSILLSTSHRQTNTLINSRTNILSSIPTNIHNHTQTNTPNSTDTLENTQSMANSREARIAIPPHRTKREVKNQLGFKMFPLISLYTSFPHQTMDSSPPFQSLPQTNPLLSRQCTTRKISLGQTIREKSRRKALMKNTTNTLKMAVRQKAGCQKHLQLPI